MQFDPFSPVAAPAPPTPADDPNEGFYSPRTAFARDADLDLAGFDQGTHAAGKPDLARKSLYVAFDPLVSKYVLSYYISSLSAHITSKLTRAGYTWWTCS